MTHITEKYRTLMIRLFSGEIDETAKADLDAWLKSSEENQKVFEQYEMLWMLKPSKPSEKISDREETWRKITEKIDQADDKLGGKKTRYIKLPRVYISAAAALVIIIMGLFFFLPKSEKTRMISQSGERDDKPVELSDGTLVYFKNEGTLVYPEIFGEDIRRVELTGDAFFEVAKENKNNKTFIVELNEVSIVVEGTSFLISQSNTHNDVDVSVVTGQISMLLNADPQKRIEIIAGERGRYSSSADKFSKTKISDYNFMAWRTGKLEFNEAPLVDVFDLLEETYEIDVDYQGELPDVKLTARFVDESHEDIFKTIHLLYGLDFEFKEGVYYIK
jgi:transmembrane sensor